MSTTVVHPGSVSGHGPSGRTIGTAVAGVVIAAALGFAIVNESAPEAGVSQGTVGATVTQADFVAHTESLAGELQALQGVAKPTNQPITWTEFVNMASVATATELAQARRVAEIQAMNTNLPQASIGTQVAQADFVAHAESLAGELQALQGVGVNAQELAQARRVAEIQAMNEYPANSGSKNEGPGLEPGASGIR
jgi:hypothetical protein